MDHLVRSSSNQIGFPWSPSLLSLVVSCDLPNRFQVILGNFSFYMDEISFLAFRSVLMDVLPGFISIFCTQLSTNRLVKFEKRTNAPKSVGSLSKSTITEWP